MRRFSGHGTCLILCLFLLGSVGFSQTYRINAGGSDYTDGNGDLFEADKAYVSGDYGYTGGLTTTWTDNIANTEEDLLYQSMRYIRNNTFSYTFDNLANGDYDITFKMQDPTSTAANNRTMDITVEGVLELDNLDVYALAGNASDAAFDTTVTTTVSDGSLNITFDSGSGDGRIFISAMVVSSAAPPVDPDISLSATSLDFGTVDVGDSSDMTVSVSNVGVNDLTVSSLSTDNGTYSIVSPATPVTVVNGTPVDVVLRFKPTSGATENGDLTIDSDDPDEASVTVSLTGIGNSVDPDIDLSTTSVAFGNVGVGDSSDISLTISNLGVNDLNVTSISSDNAVFEVVSPATPIVVANGAPADVVVRFKPTSEVAESGNLTIDSDDPDEASLNVTLDGTGISTDPDIDVSPLALDYGTVTNGGASDLTVTVSNTGVDDLTVSSVTSSNSVYTVVSPATPFTVTTATPVDVTVRFSPTVAQTETGDLDIVSDDPDEATTTVSLTGVGSDAPTVDYKINIGGSDFTALDGTFYEADPAYVSGGYGYTGGLTTTWGDAISGTEDDLLYQAMRYDRDNSFDYTFDNFPNGDYEITMHFQDPTSNSVGNRTFDVTVEGILELDNLDVFDEAGGQDAAYTTSIIASVFDGQLNIDFTPATGDGRLFVCAIEITDAPPPPLEADIDVGPENLDFGNVSTSSFLELSVQVSNKGLSDLTVSGLATTNPVYTVQSPAVPFTIPGLGTPVDVVVRFSPTQFGAEIDDLVITSDDIDEGTVTVPMTGTGSDPALGPTFVDVTIAAGVLQKNNWAGTCTDPEVSTGGAWGDYDNDGDQDLYVPDYFGPNQLYRNDGDSNGDGVPEFTDVAASLGVNPAVDGSIGAQFVDYDNDGDQDLYVTNYDPNILYQNQLIETGTATFIDVTAASGASGGGQRSIGAAWGDYNQDGWVDVYVTNHRYCKDQQDNANDKLLRNNGDGTFSDVTGYLCDSGLADCDQITGLGFSPAWIDYDDDNDLDMYVINDLLGGNRGNTIWRNDGSDGAGGWEFTDVTDATGLNQVVNGMGLAIGDYNRDGWYDFAFTNILENYLMRANGDGTYTDVALEAGVQHAFYPNGTESVTWSTFFFDYNNDMWEDLFYACGEIRFDGDDWHGNLLYENNGNDTFTDISQAAGVDDSSRARHTAWVDLNNDGFLEYYLSNIDEDPVLYINNSIAQGNTNHWLKVTVEGTESCRDAYGTKMTLVTGDGVSQIRQISSGSSHSGGDEKAAFFGLADNTTADLTIRWTNGVTETHVGVAIDTALHFVEPASGARSANIGNGNQVNVEALPKKFALHQNYPNPFNPSTTISFDLPRDMDVTLKIYNVLGEEVRTLTTDFYQAGTHQVVWDGKDNFGNALSSGLYLYRLKSDVLHATKKMYLVQ